VNTRTAPKPLEAPGSERSLRSWTEKLLPEEIFLLMAGALAATLCSTLGARFAVLAVAGEYAWLLFYNLALLVILSRAVLVYRQKNPNPGAYLNALHLPSEVTLVRSTFFLISYLVIYTNVKIQIPLFNSALLDAPIAEFERRFLGDPVGLARGLASIPWLVKLLDRIYHHQYLMMTLTVLLLFLNNGPRHVRHLFTSFAVLYLGGIAISVLVPVVGPCFVNPSQYEWAMGTQARDNQGLLGFVYQAVLTYRETGEEFQPRAFVGISAFPSLHVGHCMMLSLFAWHYHRKLLRLYIPILLLTWLATLVLGWHYLIDGVAVIPMVFAAWWVSEKMIFGGKPGSRVDPKPSAG